MQWFWLSILWNYGIFGVGVGYLGAIFGVGVSLGAWNKGLTRVFGVSVGF